MMTVGNISASNRVFLAPWALTAAAKILAEAIDALVDAQSLDSPAHDREEGSCHARNEDDKDGSDSET